MQQLNAQTGEFSSDNQTQEMFSGGVFYSLKEGSYYKILGSAMENVKKEDIARCQNAQLRSI